MNFPEKTKQCWFLPGWREHPQNSIQVQPGEPVSFLGLCIALFVTQATKKSHSWCLGSYTSEEPPGVAQDYTGRDPTQSTNSG